VAQAAIATATEPQQRDGSRTVTVTPRSIPVAHGQTIVVRPVKPQDEPGLADLYDGLDVGDRYRRFFCSYRPSHDFIQSLANPGPREAGVVAELIEPTAKRLVAEAGDSFLADGIGEFAMVVAREWRGWLGPYLLDLVVDLAVPLLPADVGGRDRERTRDVKRSPWIPARRSGTRQGAPRPQDQTGFGSQDVLPYQ
jgi:hypothetical protein